jgi:hypothetical protein
MRWPRRYLDEASSTLQQFADIAADLAGREDV